MFGVLTLILKGAIMKKIILTLVVIATCFWSCSVFSQTGNEMLALGMPGDNLNLYAVLDVFQKSKTLEEFERALNSQSSKINNLDLNNDNQIDYISVISYNQGNFHSIVLRVPINSYEFQDVAVIEVSKNNLGNIVVQIIGDEALYGENYVIEPSVRVASETPNPGYIGNRTIIANNYVYGNGIIYISEWPIILYLYSPLFSVYVSPWHWGYFPPYWYPWHPILYYNYWSFHNHYYRSPIYRRASYIRFPSNHSYYLTKRTTSTIVTRNRETGTYNRTYEGRTYRQPPAPPRLSRAEIRRENRETVRQQTKSSVRQENRESIRKQTQPSTRPPVRQENRQSTRQQVAPSVKPQSRSSIRQSARQSARETRRINRSESQRKGGL